MIEKLVGALERKGWTQDAFEARAMLSRNRISKWKNGQGEPTARQALVMARLLDLPLEYLVDDDQDAPMTLPRDDAERLVWEAVRTLGTDEAWRRLLVPTPAGQSVKLGPPKVLSGGERSGEDPIRDHKPLAAKE